MRIAVPEGVAAYIAARIAGFPDEADERHRWQSRYVAEFGALPLYLGWFETIGIRPGGEVITWSTEGEFAGTRPVEERTCVVSALVAGSERFPELRQLLPEREPGATDCPCRNHPLVASGQVLCGECGGVGWLPAQRHAEPGAAPDPAPRAGPGR